VAGAWQRVALAAPTAATCHYLPGTPVKPPLALQGKDNPADVISVALEVLSAQRCELPAYLTLDRGYQRRIGGWKARR
jgi:hypothetical protein